MGQWPKGYPSLGSPQAAWIAHAPADGRKFREHRRSKEELAPGRR
jgi:hypothetical protein